VILYLTADYSTTATRILILFSGECWAQYQLSNGIRYVSVASELRKSLSSVECFLGIKLVIFYSMADYSTPAVWILNPLVGDCWARRQLSNHIRYVSVASKLRNLLSSVERIFIVLVALDIFYLMADYSTTAGPILILFAGGCWARRQPPNGIRYVSVTSELMNLPTLLRVVPPKVHELDGRCLHNRWADSGSDCWRLLGLMSATRWYKVCLCRIRTYGSASPSESSLSTTVMEIPIADNSMSALPILDLIAGDCWPLHQLYNDIRCFPRKLYSWSYSAEWCAGNPRTQWLIPPQLQIWS